MDVPHERATHPYFAPTPHRWVPKVICLQTQLQNAPELVRTIEASAAEEKTEARERIARLERTVHCAEREHALFSNRAESRLEGPRAVIAVKEQEVGAEVSSCDRTVCRGTPRGRSDTDIRLEIEKFVRGLR